MKSIFILNRKSLSDFKNFKWTTYDLPSENNWISVCWSPELNKFCATSYQNKIVALGELI